jgi:hypothetical protein
MATGGGDFLLLGLFLYANKQPADAAAALRDGCGCTRPRVGICLLAADDLAAGMDSLERAARATGDRSQSLPRYAPYGAFK